MKVKLYKIRLIPDYIGMAIIDICMGILKLAFWLYDKTSLTIFLYIVKAMLYISKKLCWKIKMRSTKMILTNLLMLAKELTAEKVELEKAQA